MVSTVLVSCRRDDIFYSLEGSRGLSMSKSDIRAMNELHLAPRSLSLLLSLPLYLHINLRVEN